MLLKCFGSNLPAQYIFFRLKPFKTHIFELGAYLKEFLAAGTVFKPLQNCGALHAQVSRVIGGHRLISNYGNTRPNEGKTCSVSAVGL